MEGEGMAVGDASGHQAPRRRRGPSSRSGLEGRRSGPHRGSGGMWRADEGLPGGDGDPGGIDLEDEDGDDGQVYISQRIWRRDHQKLV